MKDVVKTLYPEVEVKEEDVFLAMGYGKQLPKKKRLIRLVREWCLKIPDIAKPKVLLCISSREKTLKNFGYSKKLDHYLEPAEKVAWMVGTAGHEIREFGKTLKDEGEPFLQYLLDIFSTAIARNTYHYVQNYLNMLYSGYGTGILLSPGNNLPLSMQEKMVNVMPIKKIDVTFLKNASMLMPLASVSGIYGIGRYPHIEGSHCKRCSSLNCSLREEVFDLENFKKNMRA